MPNLIDRVLGPHVRVITWMFHSSQWFFLKTSSDLTLWKCLKLHQIITDSAEPNLSSSQGLGNTGRATYDFLRFLVPFAHHVQST